jgi:hypothetical protein
VSRNRRLPGGRREPHDEELRRRAMEYSDRHGAVAAGAKFGIPAGTVRSWIRREFVKAERARVDESGLEQVMREGRAIVAQREAQLRDPERAAEVERARLEKMRRIEAGSRRESGDESEEPS